MTESDTPTILDWNVLCQPPAVHFCDCDYCDREDEEPDWPHLIRLTFGGTECITDRYLCVRAERAPVPTGYEGRVYNRAAAPQMNRPLEWPVTSAPATGKKFLPATLTALRSTGWRLRLIDSPADATEIESRTVAVVDEDGVHIGWTIASDAGSEYSEP